MLTGLHLLTAEFILILTIILSLGVAAFAGQYEKVKLLPSFGLVPIIFGIIIFLFLNTQGGFVFDKELLIVDGVSQLAKSLILLIVIGCFFISAVRIFNSDKKFNPHRTEFFTTMLISALGMMVMVSANDLMTFYMGLEIQSLALYILIAYRRASALSSEAALKYLILGAVGSGLFLYGTSLLFAAAGSVSYELLHSFAFMSGNNLVYLVGATLVLTALFFKLSAVPFHMWTPDVYQGAPIFVTAFVATAPKVAAIFGLLRMIGYAFQPVAANFQSILIIVSVLSLVVGAVMAVRQTSLLRLVAYSTITHMGYIFLGIASQSDVVNFPVIAYTIIYSLTSFGLFALIGAIRVNNAPLATIQDLSGLAKRYPNLACILAVFILSLAGIPPLAGFFIKFSILKSALTAHLIIPSILAVIASAISAYYYLRILKVVFFDTPIDDAEFDIDKTYSVIASIIAVLLIGYVIYPSLSADILGYFISHYGYYI